MTNLISEEKPFAPIAEGEVTKEEIMAKKEAGEFFQWPYQDLEFGASGYDDLLPAIQSVSSEMYLAEKDPEIRAEMEEYIFKIYRMRDIFPIRYLDEDDVFNEVMKCISYSPEWKGDTIRSGAGIGTALCNWMMPNLYQVYSQQDNDKGEARSAYGKFMDDEWLRKAISFSLNYQPGYPVPNSIRSSLAMIGSMPTNFLPMNARAIWERLAPEGGIVWDYASGFGGRLLGALTSPNNYTYIGTDPNVETMSHLHELGEAIERVTGRENSYELHCVGSEYLEGPTESIETAFASPPYFNLEVYSDDETQSYNQYPEVDAWLEGYVRPTVKNIARMLKTGRKYAVNAADFTIRGGERVNFVDAWKQISEEEGLPFHSNLYLEVQARAGTKLQKIGSGKKENILVFEKPLRF